MYKLVWIAISAFLCGEALAQFPERTHRIFDKFPHGLKEQGEPFQDQIDNLGIPQFENAFIPAKPARPRIPEFPPKYIEDKEDYEHRPFNPDKKLFPSLKEKEHEPLFPPNRPPLEFANPKFEPFDLRKKPDEISREAIEGLKDFEQFKHLVDDYQKRLFLRNERPDRPLSHNLSPQIGTSYGDRKHSGSHSNEFVPTNYHKQNNFPEEFKSSTEPNQPINNSFLNPSVPKVEEPVFKSAFEHQIRQPSFEGIKHPPSYLTVNHKPALKDEFERIKEILSKFPTYDRINNEDKTFKSPLQHQSPRQSFEGTKQKPTHLGIIPKFPLPSRNEFQRIKDFLSQPVRKDAYPDFGRISHEDRNPTPVELDFTMSNKSEIYLRLLRTLREELPTRPDFQRVYKLKLLVKPPEGKNTTFVKDFMNTLRNITTKLIPDAITGAKITAFKKNNETLSIFQVNLYVKYLNRWNFEKLHKTNYTNGISSEKILNERNETIVKLETDKNNTIEIAKIDLDKITSDYEESLKSILYELLENSTRFDEHNKSIVLISIKLPLRGPFGLTSNLFRAAQSVMCKVAPNLITFEHLKLPRDEKLYSPRIEIVIPIQGKDTLHHLEHLNLTHSHESLIMEVAKRVSEVLNVITRCQPANITSNFNLTIFLPKYERTESIRDILKEVTNLARMTVPHHRIYIETQTETLPNSLKLELNITLKPSSIFEYDGGNEKEISIDLRRPGSTIVPEILKMLPVIIKEIEESSKPISLVFNVSFALGTDKDFVRAEIIKLITLLEEAIPIEYGAIANVILKITVIPTRILRENAIMHDIKLHEYEESLMRTTESFMSEEYNNATKSNSSTINEEISEGIPEIMNSAPNSLKAPFEIRPANTSNRNPLLDRIQKANYPRSKPLAISTRKIPRYFRQPHPRPRRPSMYTRLPFKKPWNAYRRPLYSYLPYRQRNFRKFPRFFHKPKFDNMRRNAERRNFPPRTWRPRMTTVNSNTFELEETTTVPSNVIENWTESEEPSLTSAAYHTPRFSFPIRQTIYSATQKIPSSFENINEIYQKLHLFSSTTSKYESSTNHTISNEEYRAPWKPFFRNLRNKYEHFQKLPSHFQKHILRHIPTSWRTPLHERNIKQLFSRFIWPSIRSTTAESNTMESESSTTLSPSSVENWTESKNIPSISPVYHTPMYPHFNLPFYTISPYKRHAENINQPLQSIHKYLKHKYHKFRKLPHHLRKHILKNILSSWKKPVNEKKIDKFLAKIMRPNMESSPTTQSTTIETSSSNLFETSSEQEQISSTFLAVNSYPSASQHSSVSFQTTPSMSHYNRKYNYRQQLPSFENFKLSSTNFNSFLTSTSESTESLATTTPSEPSSSSTENTNTTPTETTAPTETTTPTTVLTSTFEPKTTTEVENSETSTIENPTTEYLEQTSNTMSEEYFNEYTTSNETPMTNTPEQSTFSTYANAPKEFEAPQSSLLLPAQAISAAMPPTNERMKRLMYSAHRTEVEETTTNITPEDINAQTASFLDNGKFRKFKLKKPLNWMPKNFNPRKIKWPNVSTKENSFQNNFPNENSIEESLSSRTTRGGEIIDKESSLQYNENGHFSVKKRTLNLSNSNSEMFREIEKNVLSMLRQNEDEPTVLLFKIIPKEGMLVSDLRKLTEPLLSLLISDFPTSEVNIITKAYYNKYQEIELMKMKITVNYSNDEPTDNEENVYLAKYLKIIIQKILEDVEMNPSGQVVDFNFTIDYPSEVTKAFNSHLLKSLEAILSQILPYENIDIRSSSTPNSTNITSSLVNVIITPTSKKNSIIWAPVINLDGLSPHNLKFEIENLVLRYLLNVSTSDQNISAVIDFVFETNRLTTFDIIELENSISKILNEMEISGKFLPMNARLQLNKKEGIVFTMPFSITTTKNSLKTYIENSYRKRQAKTKNSRPIERISDLILED